MARASFWILLTSGLLVGAILALHRYIGPPQLGQAIVWLALLYNVVLLGGALLRSHHDVVAAWLFLAPLSIFQVMPDSLLSQEFGVLSFPDLGAERIAGVPMYMAGLWVCPLLLVIWAADLAERFSSLLSVLVAAIVSLAIFGAAEIAARPLSLWAAHNVAMWEGVAIYVLAAEMLLGIAVWLMYTQVRARAVPMKWLGAAAVSAFYAGVLVAGLFISRRYL